MAEQKKHTTIDTSEDQLNLLFRELLEGCRDDLEEAKQNCEIYFDAIINTDSGKSIFGQLYNESLKIKGDARDKQLKLLNMFKDRVSVKERNTLNKKDDGISNMPSQSAMIKIFEDMALAKKSAGVETFTKELLTDNNPNEKTEPNIQLEEGFYLDEEFEEVDEFEEEIEENLNTTEEVDDEELYDDEEE